MLNRMNEEERKAYFALFDQAEALEPWRKQLREQARDEAWKKGVAFGEINGEVKKSREFIQKFMSREFNDHSNDLQAKVLQLHTPEIVNFVLDKLFAASTLKEAQTVINNGIAEESKRQNTLLIL